MVGSVPVSVVIPAFERPDRVGLAVASAFAQDPAPTEVIVVDDCSSDDTAAVAEAAGATVLRQPTNQGQGPARNRGMEAARCEWIALLDSDDVWLPGHLARVWARRDGYVLVADCGRGTVTRRIFGHPGPGELRLSHPSDAITRSMPVLTSGALVRRADALAVGGFSERRRAQDLEFLARVLERGPALALPDVGVEYFQHPGQVSADTSATRHDHLDVVLALADRSWFRPAHLRAAEAIVGWDVLRAALRDRSFDTALRTVPKVVGSPTRVRALLQMLRDRRYNRRRALEV